MPWNVPASTASRSISADIAAQLAHEDRVQAQAALLPSVNWLNQFIYTQPNGSHSGVFVSNDGPHIYNNQAVVHGDIYRSRQARRLPPHHGGRSRGTRQGRYRRPRPDRYGSAELLRAGVRPAERRQRASRACARPRSSSTSPASRSRAGKWPTPMSSRRRSRSNSAGGTHRRRNWRWRRAASVSPSCCSRISARIFRLWTIWRPPRLCRLSETSRRWPAKNNPEIRAAQATVQQETHGVIVGARRVAAYALVRLLLRDQRQPVRHLQSANTSGTSAPPRRCELTDPGLELGRHAQQDPAGGVAAAAGEGGPELHAAATAGQSERVLPGGRGGRARSSASLRSIPGPRRRERAADAARATQAGEATALEVVDAQTTLAQARNAD